MASSHTPADDIVYDIISIQYHALKGAQLYDKFMDDARGCHDHPQVLEFLEQVKREDAQRAVRCHDLLTTLTQEGIDRDVAKVS